MTTQLGSGTFLLADGPENPNRYYPISESGKGAEALGKADKDAVLQKMDEGLRRASSYRPGTSNVDLELGGIEEAVMRAVEIGEVDRLLGFMTEAVGKKLGAAAGFNE